MERANGAGAVAQQQERDAGEIVGQKIARMRKIDITGSSVTARVGIGRDDAGFGIVAELTAHLPSVDEATAKALVEKADEICPYSKVTRGDIEVTIKTA